VPLLLFEAIGIEMLAAILKRDVPAVALPDPFAQAAVALRHFTSS